MYEFNYSQPADLADALAQIAGNPDGKLLAGGQTLLPTMKQRLASPSALIDLGRVKGLTGISDDGSSVTIGAMTRHFDVANSQAVKKIIPVLADMVGTIGDAAVRHRGTIGGSIANNDPSADYPSACLALGATIVTDRREIAAEDFFTGLFDTALEEGEIITKVRFPKPEKAGYQKFRNPASRYAIVAVFVAKVADGVRVAVTGAGSGGVFRWSEAEAALSKDLSPKAVEGLKADASNLNSDIHADAEYRAHLIGVLTRRAVADMK